MFINFGDIIFLRFCVKTNCLSPVFLSYALCWETVISIHTKFDENAIIADLSSSSRVVKGVILC